MLSLQSDPRQHHQQQVQNHQQQVHQQHQQLLQQVVGVVNYSNSIGNNSSNSNNVGGGVDRRSDLVFSLHNDSGALPPSANIKQELLSREGIFDFCEFGFSGGL